MGFLSTMQWSTILPTTVATVFSFDPSGFIPYVTPVIHLCILSIDSDSDVFFLLTDP